MSRLIEQACHKDLNFGLPTMKKYLFVWLLVLGFSPALAQKTTVFVFLSESCPVCQYYTPKLRDMQAKFGDEVRWVAVFPNKMSSDTSAINFLLRHDLAMQIRMDQKLVFSKVYGVEVTPEVVVKDNKGRMKYRGRIDDHYTAPGKRKARASTNELEEVLLKLSRNVEVTYTETRAVGCLLNSSQ